MKTIDLIAGARPNFMKIAPIINALKAAQARGSALRYRLIHTGQHYDKAMSGSFFEQLGIPEPDINLEVGSGTQADRLPRSWCATRRCCWSSAATCAWWWAM
jgi:UDP-N-acetylglucosamine 2-epimerase (non-hydrolysing)